MQDMRLIYANDSHSSAVPTNQHRAAKNEWRGKSCDVPVQASKGNQSQQGHVWEARQ